MKLATWVMAILALALVIVAYFRGHAHVAGLKVGGRMFVQVLPMLIASFAIAGIVQVLVPKEAVARLLGPESGFRGIMIGCVAGALAPGAPYINFPIVAAVYQAGASVGTVVGFVTAWALWQVARIPVEVAIIGPKITLVRVLATLVFPPLAGWLSLPLGRLLIR
jgi:uncharacterized membrane protein YraQ (UPF0718 family)